MRTDLWYSAPWEVLNTLSKSARSHYGNIEQINLDANLTSNVKLKINVAIQIMWIFSSLFQGYIHPIPNLVLDSNFRNLHGSSMPSNLTAVFVLALVSDFKIIGSAPILISTSEYRLTEDNEPGILNH